MASNCGKLSAEERKATWRLSHCQILAATFTDHLPREQEERERESETPRTRESCRFVEEEDYDNFEEKEKKKEKERENSLVRQTPTWYGYLRYLHRYLERDFGILPSS